jgi:hypothetical protein
VLIKIHPTSGESAYDISARDIVAALFDPRGDTPEPELHRGNLQVNDFDLPSCSLPALQHSDIGESAQGAFESKVFLRASEPIQLMKKESAGRDRGKLRPERRESTGD